MAETANFKFQKIPAGATNYPSLMDAFMDSLDTYLGRMLDASAYASFSAAVTAAEASGKTLAVSTSVNLTQNQTVACPICPIAPGVINASGFTLTLNGHVVGNPMHQWLSGFAAGEVKLAQPICANWFAESGDGRESTPFLVDFAIADGAISLPGECGAIYLYGGSYYKIKTAPYNMVNADYLYGVGGRAVVLNTTATANAINQITNRDNFSISNIMVIGVRTGGQATGKGIYVSSTQINRWSINNVVCINNGSHGLHVEDGCWIGNINGRFSNNGGDGIRIDAGVNGAPNGIDMFAVSAEGNTGWGVRVGGTNYAIPGTVNIFGGVVETNTLGGIKADGVEMFSIIGTHMEGDTIEVGVGSPSTKSVQLCRLQGLWSAGLITVGSQCSVFDYNGGRIYSTGQKILTNTRGVVKINNIQAKDNSVSPTTATIYYEERCPNSPTYVSTHNQGKKGDGSIISNGAFMARTATNVLPMYWSNATGGAATSHLNAAPAATEYFYGRIHQIVADTDKGMVQTFSFPKSPENPLCASVWMKVAGGTGIFQITVGTRVWRLAVTSSSWIRYTIPCIIEPGANDTGTIELLGGETGSTIIFAEAQVVKDMDTQGYRYNSATIVSTNVNTSGYTLAQLETVVNEVKQILRDIGLLPT